MSSMMCRYPQEMKFSPKIGAYCIPEEKRSSRDSTFYCRNVVFYRCSNSAFNWSPKLLASYYVK